MAPSSRPTYTEEQLQKYLRHVGMPERIPQASCDSEDGLKYLNKLIPLQLAKVPFENLDLHYSQHKSASLDSEYLFDRVVERNAGRGGYCMQNNLFFATILRSLGYKVMPCGSRVSSATGGVTDLSKITYSGWSHTVNLVMIDGKKYFCDVGFGSNCPTRAVPMIDGWTGRYSWKNEGEDMRLNRTHILDNTFTGEEQKLWVWEIRFSQDGPWLPHYCFSEVEFLPQDFNLMSYHVSNSLYSIFPVYIMGNKGILDEDGNWIGEYTLWSNTFKMRTYGKSEVLAEVKSEQERIEALEKYFGIKLNVTERSGITEYNSMLRG